MWSQVKIEMEFFFFLSFFFTLSSRQAVDILVAGGEGKLLPEYFSSSLRSASFFG